MARELDLSNPEALSVEDLEYLSQRESLIREAELLGVSGIRDLIAARHEERQEDDEVDYEDLTVDELKEELTNRGLPTGGKKEELVARLDEDDASA